MTEPAVHLEGVTFNRGARKIFDGVDMQIATGKITAVMGPSGTGKTTLLRLIGGQLLPSHGVVRVFGQQVDTLRHAELYRLRKRMGMLFQSSALLTDIDVFENVAFPLRAHTKLPERLIRDIVLMKLEIVGLRGARRLRIQELSGGMARRVALARAIVLDPEMVLYDEPFVGLDPISMGAIVRALKTINEVLRITSVIVTHDVIEVASIADEVFLLAGGRIEGHGAPHALYDDASPWVRQFMHGLADGPVPFHYPAPGLADDFLGT
jgi:phospholipid/cholesterol/gamma-HCH transport system ATP-binding protein